LYASCWIAGFNIVLIYKRIYLLNAIAKNIADSVLQVIVEMAWKLRVLKLMMGANLLVILPAESMTIISQPQPQTDCYGNHVEFTVAVSESVGTVYYQWQQKPPGESFSDINGANNALLTIDNIGVNAQHVDGTEYRVLITDDNGTIISDPALLRVNSITGLIPAVVNSTICSNESIAYNVFAVGDVIENGYLWSMNNGSGWSYLSDGGAYSGTTTSELLIYNSTIAQNGSYRASVIFATLNQPPGDPTCVETSFTRERNLVVREPLAPPLVSASQQICYGNIPSVLTVTSASGGSGPDYAYQWQRSYDGSVFADLPDENSLSYSPPALIVSTYYRISVTDEGSPSCGTVYSEPVLISVNQLPETSPIYHR
jgi:hypothetical protein